MKFFQSSYLLFVFFISLLGCNKDQSNNTAQNNSTQTLNVKYEVIATDLYRLVYTNATGSVIELNNQSGNFGLEFKLTGSVLNKKSVQVAAYSNSNSSILTARVYVNGIIYKEATGNSVICSGWLPEN